MTISSTVTKKKVDYFVEVKRIIEHTSSLLEDIFTTVQGGTKEKARVLKKLPLKIKLVMESVSKVDNLVGIKLINAHARGYTYHFCRNSPK